MLKQTNNLCLLFSILNALPNDEARKTFLDDADGKTNKVETFMKEVDVKIWVGEKKWNVDEHGLVTEHIQAWLKHLEKQGKIKSGWKYQNTKMKVFLGQFISPHKYAETFGQTPKPTNEELGQMAFILVGRSSATNMREEKVKLMAKAFSVEPSAHKKKTIASSEKKEENVGELQRRFIALREHIAGGVVEGNKKKSKKSKQYWENKYIGRHAVCIKYDNNGKAWLYDPGRLVPRCLAVENLADDSRVREVLKEYCTSLLETYQVFRFSMECNN